MRLRACSVALALAALVAVPGAAHASFHLQTGNEVMLASASGDPSVRFVELFDPSAEPFPAIFGPYGLAIYDGAASKLSSQTLSGPGMASAASAGRPYLVSTAAADAALGVTGDEVLTVALPKPVGQACYTAGGTPYSCITWGCVKKFVDTSGTGSFHGATPADGQSAQRQPSGAVQLAAPTPRATNRAGSSPRICPPPPFGGVRIPDQTATARQGKVPVVVRCPAAATGRCEGRLVLKTAKKIGPKGHRRIVTLGSKTFSIARGKGPKVRVPLSDAGKRAVANHKSLAAVATATAHDSRGKTKTTSGQVEVKRP